MMHHSSSGQRVVIQLLNFKRVESDHSRDFGASAYTFTLTLDFLYFSQNHFQTPSTSLSNLSLPLSAGLDRAQEALFTSWQNVGEWRSPPTTSGHIPSPAAVEQQL